MKRAGWPVVTHRLAGPDPRPLCVEEVVSIVRSIADRHRQLLPARVTNCFLCGRTLTFPFVYWAGCGSPVESVAGLPMAGWEGVSVALHPDCVGDLFKRMMRDVMEIEGLVGPYRPKK